MSHLNGFFLEAFYTGSHRYFADSLCKVLPFDMKLITLPGRHWKWRMHEAAISFSKRLESLPKPDFVITSDMTDLATLKGLTPKLNSVPSILYMHENQITYPWNETDKDLDLQRNHHYGFINYTSMLAADRVIFNSTYHMESLLGAMSNFLSMFPDNRGMENIDVIRQKSLVIYPGIDFKEISESNDTFTSNNSRRKTVVWNHRWEYDKQPELFFNTLLKLKNEGLKISLIVLGESTQSYPPIFNKMRQSFQGNIEHWGYCKDRKEYEKYLLKGDVLPVTSMQDFFGISTLEGIAHGLFPLLPNRLAFPEHIPETFRELCVYQNDDEFEHKLRNLLTSDIPDFTELTSHIRDKYNWKKTIDKFTEQIGKIIAPQSDK